MDQHLPHSTVAGDLAIAHKYLAAVAWECDICLEISAISASVQLFLAVVNPTLRCLVGVGTKIPYSFASF